MPTDPKSETSITFWLRKFGAMTPAEVIGQVPAVHEMLKTVADEEVPMIALASLRTLMSLINKPDARLFKEVVERLEGKMPSTVKTWRDQWIEAIRNGDVDRKVVEEELGEELAHQLFNAAGVHVNEPAVRDEG